MLTGSDSLEWNKFTSALGKFQCQMLCGLVSAGTVARRVATIHLSAIFFLHKADVDGVEWAGTRDFIRPSCYTSFFSLPHH